MVPAHKLMLAAHSPLLSGLMKHAEEEEAGDATRLVVPDLPGWAVQVVVSVMYGKGAFDLWGPGGELILQVCVRGGAVAGGDPCGGEGGVAGGTSGPGAGGGRKGLIYRGPKYRSGVNTLYKMLVLTNLATR